MRARPRFGLGLALALSLTLTSACGGTSGASDRRAAAAALAELDPREAIESEFSFADGSRRTALIEVGDFAAGRAFLLAAQR